MIKNIFDKQVSEQVIGRVDALTTESQAKWGKMDVAQMLAHCNVTYEMAYEDIHPKPGAFKRFMLKMFVKPIVTNDKPYKKNGRTAPEFIIADTKDFDREKKRLTDYIRKTQQLGPAYFEGKESHSFGPLHTKEWNNMFYKHLDHHLSQFGV